MLPRIFKTKEGTAGQLDVEKLGGVWYAKTTSFINQAGWLGSREQVLEWNSTCREPFLDGWGCVAGPQGGRSGAFWGCDRSFAAARSPVPAKTHQLMNGSTKSFARADWPL